MAAKSDMIIKMLENLHLGIGLSWACNLVFTTSKGVTAKETRDQSSSDNIHA